jgi:TonB-linked SusC/RagA family outer membrane protein
MLVMLCSLSALAQDGAVTGKVTDQSGTGLPGVNVVLKGTTIGAITDADGMYRVTATADGTLVFSFIGYATQEVTIGGRTSLDVLMAEDATTLEQIVVIGYGTQRKKDLTTAVAVVDESAIADRPMISAGEALQGKAAGVQVVQNSGKPGAPISIRIRGAASIESGNEPLYVVDGVQTTNISGINPSDIASMSVLKDAASSSIYGARATNGVVIITTKRGRSNTPTVRFDTYVGFSQIRKTLDVLNTEQYKDLMDEVPAVGAVDPSITNYTDWNKEVFGTGVVQNYQLSFSGGSETSQYMVSGNYLKNNGIVDPAVFDRYSVRVNLDNQLKKWFKIGTNINFLHLVTKNTPDNLSSGRGGVFMSTLNTPPFLNMYKSDGSGQFDPNPFQAAWENPGAYMYGPDQQDTENRLFGNLNSEITLLPKLLFKTNLGIDLSMKKEDYYLDPFRTNQGRQEHGTGYANRNIFQTWILENLLDYSKSFGSHNFNILAGSSLQGGASDYSYISGSDFPEDTNVKTLNAANTQTGGTSYSDWNLVSFLARLTYDYKSKYLLTASLRRDGSSKLANPWGTMPSLSAGWRISEETFMSDVSFINDLKIRYSYGISGNQEGIADYAKFGLTSYQRRPVTTPRTGPASTQATFGNKDLKWETITQNNIGIDVVAFNSRVTVTFDAYIKKTDDLIIPVALPQTTGLPIIMTNAGDMENKGIELNISSVNVDKAVTWTSDFNIAFNRNKVTRINENLSSNYQFGRIYSNNQESVILKPGLALGTYYGYISDGVDPATGDIMYRDIDDNGIINPDDRTVIGNGQPDFIYGLTNNLSYKRWKLNVFFQGSQGNDIFNATRVDLEGMFDSKNQSTVVLNRWTPDNQITDIPRAGNIQNVNNSTRFVEDGSYLRLKVVTLSYDLNPDFLQKLGIKRFSVYGTGQNLLTFTNYSGFDPEVNAFNNSATVLGVDYGTYPQARTIIFGINMEF